MNEESSFSNIRETVYRHLNDSLQLRPGALSYMTKIFERIVIAPNGNILISGFVYKSGNVDTISDIDTGLSLVELDTSIGCCLLDKGDYDENVFHIKDFIKGAFTTLYGSYFIRKENQMSEKAPMDNTNQEYTSIPNAARAIYCIFKSLRTRVMNSINVAIEKEKPSCEISLDSHLSRAMSKELEILGYKVLTSDPDDNGDVLMEIIWFED